MDANRIIQSMWVGKSLSTVELLCLNSFIKNGHEFHLYAYEPIDNIPKEVYLKDASEIISPDEVKKDGFGSFSGFADVFRYMMLYKKGGWWVDMDSVCLQYFNFPGEYCFSSERSRDGSYVVNNGYIKAPAGAEFLEEIIDFIKQSDVQIGNSNGVWGDFGPRLIAEVLRKYDSMEFIQPPDTFCPIGWYELSKLITKPIDQVMPSSSIALHLWNSVWNKAFLDKNATYHPESIFERLKAQFL